MKVVVISNYFTFHQSAIWDEINKHSDIELIYLATANDLMESRKKMGYEHLVRDYVKYSFKMNEDELASLFKDTDIVIDGGIRDNKVKPFLVNVPHYIVCTEHLSKHHSCLKNQMGLFKWFVLDKHYQTNGEKYLLAMSSRAYPDFKRYGFKNRGYCYGYFPEIEVPKEMNKDPFSMVWYGRVLKWKRVDYALLALKHLRKKDSRYHLTIIGEGEDLERIKKLAFKWALTGSMTFKGLLNHDELMKTVPNYSIQMFTSDNGEGWGVALNEGLAFSNICFANEKAGSSKFLIEDKRNGFLFHNKRTLFKALDEFLSLDNEAINNIREEARKSISEVYNPQYVSSRLYEFLLSVYNHRDFDKYQTGPISKIK